MFTGKITESDAFLDMPLTSQCLYFHLCMYADDEGFVKNPKRIQRMIGASDDDMRVLIAKNFLLAYESGVIVIKHWKMHNAIRRDRMHDTEYVEEKSMLYVKENGAYTLDPNKGQPLLTVKCPSNDGQMSGKCHTEIRLDKNRLDKVRLDKYYPNDEKLNNVFADYVAMRKKLKKPMTDRAVELAIKKLDTMSGGNNEIAIKILEQSIMNSWQGLFELKGEAPKKTESVFDAWANA